jgi:hypothetical protein
MPTCCTMQCSSNFEEAASNVRLCSLVESNGRWTVQWARWDTAVVPWLLRMQHIRKSGSNSTAPRLQVSRCARQAQHRHLAWQVLRTTQLRHSSQYLSSQHF